MSSIVNLATDLSRIQRETLVGICVRPLVFMLVMPVVGGWYLATMPPASRSWATGGSVPMTMFLTMAVGSSVVIGLYAVVGILRQRLYVNGRRHLSHRSARHGRESVSCVVFRLSHA
jgi:cytochrome d ubiquinol oxidase subunit I